MKILVACEESQVVTKAFRDIGHEAYSCDIIETSGNNPEWHLQINVLDMIACQSWDMMIAFPPCTHLCVSGARWFKDKKREQPQAIDFFMTLVNAPIQKIAIENPIGIMSTYYRKPDQIIQPWQFGHSATKATCLWLKNLPKLTPTNIVEKGEQIKFKSGRSMPKWYADAFKLPPKERAKIRSKTFKGIADAMAHQWSET